jgi:hypothetical protein
MRVFLVLRLVRASQILAAVGGLHADAGLINPSEKH